MKKLSTLLTLLFLTLGSYQAFAVYEFSPQQKSLGYNLRHHSLDHWIALIPFMQTDKSLALQEKKFDNKKKKSDRDEASSGKKKGILSLVFGSSGIGCLLILYYIALLGEPGIGWGLLVVSLVLGIVGLIFGMQSLKTGESRGLAIAGIITSAISMGLSALIGIFAMIIALFRNRN